MLKKFLFKIVRSYESQKFLKILKTQFYWLNFMTIYKKSNQGHESYYHFDQCRKEQV